MKEGIDATKEQLKAAFDFGMMYLNIKQGNMESGTFPNNYEEAIEYIYEYIINENRDKECLSCLRYKNKSCRGTIDRKRLEINKHNMCGAYSEVK